MVLSTGKVGTGAHILGGKSGGRSLFLVDLRVSNVSDGEVERSRLLMERGMIKAVSAKVVVNGGEVLTWGAINLPSLTWRILNSRDQLALSVKTAGFLNRYVSEF